MHSLDVKKASEILRVRNKKVEWLVWTNTGTTLGIFPALGTKEHSLWWLHEDRKISFGFEQDRELELKCLESFLAPEML